jgi:hypothetical protein
MIASILVVMAMVMRLSRRRDILFSESVYHLIGTDAAFLHVRPHTTTSHQARHTSHFTRHTSHFTHCTSHVTRHTSRHTSNFTHCTLCVTPVACSVRRWPPLRRAALRRISRSFGCRRLCKGGWGGALAFTVQELFADCVAGASLLVPVPERCRRSLPSLRHALARA